MISLIYNPKRPKMEKWDEVEVWIRHRTGNRY
jgi:hypothetical protein